MYSLLLYCEQHQIENEPKTCAKDLVEYKLEEKLSRYMDGKSELSKIENGIAYYE